LANEAVTKGRHAELIAMSALLANGWIVLESTVPDVFDLAITRGKSREHRRVQVKNARYRIKDGQEWVVVSGTKNNGEHYSVDEVDYFIGVYDGVAYMFKNRGQSEYWCKPAELDAKWTKLDASIANLREVE
jgi:hypothetical protein